MRKNTKTDNKLAVKEHYYRLVNSYAIQEYSMVIYKGYVGSVVFDEEAKIFHGNVIGLKDVITFQAASLKDLEKACKDSIDDYLSWCKERGEKPEKI